MPTHFPGEVRPAAGSGTPKLVYSGGPVISRVQIVAVYWSSVSSTVTGWAPGFFKALVNSAYIDALSEYNTTGQTNGTNQKIERGTFVSAVSITPSTTSTSLQDSDVSSELDAQIKSGKLPAPVLDSGGYTESLYVVFFPPGTSISDQGASSCAAGGFCGYHSSFTYSGNGKSTPYAVIPDQGGGCAQGCGQGAETDLLGSIASHETSESITDEGVGESNYAWLDQTNGEIGDICDPAGGGVGQNAGVGTLDGYTMQNEWSNENKKCELTNPKIGPQGGCTTDTDCAAPTPKCDTTTSTCVACVTSADCSGTTPTCDTTTGTCHACATNADCSGTTPICNATSGACAQCATNADCSNAAPVCTSGTCGGCTSSSDCHDPTHPQCNTGTGACTASAAGGGGADGGASGGGSSGGGIGGGSGSGSGGSIGGGGAGTPPTTVGEDGGASSGGGNSFESGGSGGHGCSVSHEPVSQSFGIAGALFGLAAIARGARRRRAER
jgi:hypothetical protein